MKPFTEQIVALRTARSLNQKELAKQAGLSAPIMNRIENGKREPTLSEALRIADALKVRLALLCGEDEPDDEPLLTEVPARYRDRFALYLERRIREVRGLSA